MIRSVRHLFSATTIAQAVPMIWERDPQKAMEQLANVVQINRAAMSEMRILLLELRPQAILKTPLNELFYHLIDAAKGRKIIKADFKVDGNDDEPAAGSACRLLPYRPGKRE